MATSTAHHKERGTFPRNPRPYNRYYAGDFGAAPSQEPSMVALSARWALTSIMR